MTVILSERNESKDPRLLLRPEGNLRFRGLGAEGSCRLSLDWC
jgi:hypothetical protein